MQQHLQNGGVLLRCFVVKNRAESGIAPMEGKVPWAKIQDLIV